MNTLKTLGAAMLIAASSTAMAVATPDKMVISASSYVELASVADGFTPDQSMTAETGNPVESTPQSEPTQPSARSLQFGEFGGFGISNTRGDL
ncbi:MAG: hypothetical protein ACKVP2_07780 [Burkholderiales bacterium]